MIKSVLEPIKMEGKKEGKMESKIETILNAIKLGISDNYMLSKLVNLPLDEIVKIRKNYNKCIPKIIVFVYNIK